MINDLINEIIYFIQKFKKYYIISIEIIDNNNLKFNFKTKNSINLNIKNLNLIKNIKVLDNNNFIINSDIKQKIIFDKNSNNYTIKILKKKMLNFIIKI